MCVPFIEGQAASYNWVRSSLQLGIALAVIPLSHVLARPRAGATARTLTAPRSCLVSRVVGRSTALHIWPTGA